MFAGVMAAFGSRGAMSDGIQGPSDVVQRRRGEKKEIGMQEERRGTEDRSLRKCGFSSM